MSAATDRFEIATDVPDRLVRVRARDAWEIATVATYKSALSDTIRGIHAAGCAPGSMIALFDAREIGPQSQDVVAAFQQQMGGPDLIPRRLATLVDSALLKRQVVRVAIPNQRTFTDGAEVIAWLLSSAAPA